MSFTVLFLSLLLIQLTTSAGLLKNQSNLKLNSQLTQNTIVSGTDYVYKPLRVTWANVYWCVSINEGEKKPKIMTCNKNDPSQNWVLRSVNGGFIVQTLDGRYAFDNHGGANHRDPLFLETPNPNVATQIITVINKQPDGNYQFQFKTGKCISYVGR